ncbi:MAG: D-alanyl-D-alanine carboxypeptidase [Clostridia bacterium]|nr:D-alanyl-D-alanine carboxypeptidase [Clostridia bacterium]
MLFKKIFCLLMSVFIACIVCLPCLAKDESWVTAHSAVLYCPENGEFLYEKNADEFSLIASLTKIMTAVVVIENTSPQETVSVDKAAVGVEGSSAYLCANELLTVENLLYALLLESANDAAVALAIHTSGSVPEFVKLMNKKAEELGMSETHYENPHGLDSDGHGSSARDLAILSAYALKNEEFLKITQTKSIHIDDCDGKNSHYFINHNRMLSIYDGTVGIKTGYTKSSGRCLVSAAKRNGVTLIAVTLNAPNDWNDHQIMLDYGFSAVKSVLLPDALTTFEINVVSGSKSTVKASAESQSFVFDRAVDTNTSTVFLKQFYFAPIKKGDIIGSIVYFYNGDVIAFVPIRAEENSDEIKYKRSFLETIAYFFR